MSQRAANPLNGACIRCVNRLQRLRLSGQQQTRGKSKTTKKATTLPVRLRQDLPEYGRKGSIVPMLFGQMRNYYYPQRIADYITPAEKLQLKKDGIVAVRDVNFGRIVPGASEGGASSAKDGPSVPRYDLKTISPMDAAELLETTIPPTLDFYRTPITEASSRRSANADTTRADEAKAAAPPATASPRQSPDNIYGSVSAADVNMAIKALLQTKDLHGQVVLPEEDTRFVNIAGTDTDATRLKKLGVYECEIRIRGHDTPIRRTVRILPDDNSGEGEQPSFAPNPDVSFPATPRSGIEGASASA